MKNMITTLLSMAALSHFCQKENTSDIEQTLKLTHTEIITFDQVQFPRLIQTTPSAQFDYLLASADFHLLAHISNTYIHTNKM
jgi:hypothetical protein